MTQRIQLVDELEVKQQFDQYQNQNITSQIIQLNNQKSNHQPQLYQSNPDSEANWNIASEILADDSEFNQFNHQNQIESFKKKSDDEISVQSVNPNEEELCGAILCLKRKLPNRSLEQTIIRLYQAMNLRKQQQSVKAQSVRNERKRDSAQEDQQFSKMINEDDDLRSISQFSISGSSEINSKVKHSEKFQSQEEGKRQKKKKKKKSKHKHKYEDQKNEQFEPRYKGPDYDQQQQIIRESGDIANYIYQPKGVEVIMNCPEIKTRKTNFINIEQEKIYRERTIFVQSFVWRGYGVSELRKEMQAQNFNLVLSRDKYITLAVGVAILAFRKLESFIVNDCGKTIKHLDKWQVRSICTVMLNCRTKLQPQITQTLFKYFRVGFGLGDIKIGQVQSVKLYLSIMKFIHGKNVTMEILQKMGAVHQKKQQQLFVQYLNQKRLKRERNLRRRKQIWYEQKIRGEAKKPKQKVKTQDLKSQHKISTIASNDISDNPADFSYSQCQSVVSASQIAQRDAEDLNDDCLWSEQMDIEFAKFYVSTQNIAKTISLMKERYEQVQRLVVLKDDPKMDKDIKKINSAGTILISNLLRFKHKQNLNKITKLNRGEQARIKLLTYYIDKQPNLQKLASVINFLIEYLNSKKPTKYRASENYMLDENQKDLYSNHRFNDVISISSQSDKRPIQLSDTSSIATDNHFVVESFQNKIKGNFMNHSSYSPLGMVQNTIDLKDYDLHQNDLSLADFSEYDDKQFDKYFVKEIDQSIEEFANLEDYFFEEQNISTF